MNDRLRGCTAAALCCLTLLACGTARADDEPAKAPSPWVLLPTFANNPKLGSSVGALGAYMTKFDAQSQLSMFGVNAQYTSTDSATAGAFARAPSTAEHPARHPALVLIACEEHVAVDDRVLDPLGTFDQPRSSPWQVIAPLGR